MKLARIRRVLLLIFIIIVILPSIIPIATSASASAPASARPNVSMEEDPAVPAGSTASSQSSARRHKEIKDFLSQLLRKYPDTIKTQGPRRKIIALTFDDVPDPRFTPQLLDVLHKYNVKATFFVVGAVPRNIPVWLRGSSVKAMRSATTPTIIPNSVSWG